MREHNHEHHCHEHCCSCHSCQSAHEAAHHCEPAAEHSHECCTESCCDGDSGDPEPLSCSCGHDHHDHEHSGCSCGCGCGCGDDHDHSAKAPFSKPAAIIGGILIVISFIVPNKLLSAVIMALGTVFIGYPLFLAGIKDLSRFHFDELGLLTIAVFASLSLAATSADPFEGTIEAMAVTVLFRLGNILEAKAIAKSKRDIEALTNIRPDYATVILDDGTQQTVAAESVSINSVILLKPGERVPIDCEVLSGTGYIDFSAITGEPLPVFAENGSKLLSGAINSDGLLTCKTVADFESSAASRIIKMVRDSSKTKGDAERLISRFAKFYTPAVIIMAMLLAFLPPLLGFGSVSVWLSRALVFLVASCPCALVISVPLTFFAGIGMASRSGILIKGSLFLESLAKADCVAFDKTGTVTYGVPVVERAVFAENSLPQDKLLKIAAAAEANSNHPAAKAVYAFAGEGNSLSVTEYSEISGMGVKLKADGDDVLCGSFRLMEQFEVDYSAIPEANIYLSVNGVLQCGFFLTDMPRTEAKTAIAELYSLGVKNVAMLTGDNERSAAKIAEQLGINTHYSLLLPEDKPKRLSELKQNSTKTVFVGDGINDAPVLAKADVGVAMGLGSDTAIEAADVVLVNEQLTSLCNAIKIARKTVKKANQNIIFALSVKAIVLLLGAMGIATMWMAVFADVGVSILAVLNSLTLLSHKN